MKYFRTEFTSNSEGKTGLTVKITTYDLNNNILSDNVDAIEIGYGAYYYNEPSNDGFIARFSTTDSTVDLKEIWVYATGAIINVQLPSGNFYGNTQAATELSGLTNPTINDSDLALINSFIDTYIRQDGFAGTSSVIERYNVKERMDTLILKHCPVIEDSLSLYDDVNEKDDDEALLDESGYYLDLDTGIISLLKTTIRYFTKGVKNLRAEYDYGFASVPADITQLANLLLAKYLKVKDSQSGASGLKSYKVGDYSETYDFMNAASDLDITLIPMIKKLQGKYNIGF